MRIDGCVLPNGVIVRPQPREDVTIGFFGMRRMVRWQGCSSY